MKNESVILWYTSIEPLKELCPTLFFNAIIGKILNKKRNVMKYRFILIIIIVDK